LANGLGIEAKDKTQNPDSKISELNSDLLLLISALIFYLLQEQPLGRGGNARAASIPGIKDRPEFL
jgi:hypothetical protein